MMETDVRFLVLGMVADKSGVTPESLTDDTSWQDLRADSLDVVEIALRLEEMFEINIPDADVRELASKPVGATIKYIEERVKQ